MFLEVFWTFNSFIIKVSIIETSPFIYSPSQWIGFYMIRNSVLKELKHLTGRTQRHIGISDDPLRRIAGSSTIKLPCFQFLLIPTLLFRLDFEQKPLQLVFCQNKYAKHHLKDQLQMCISKRTYELRSPIQGSWVFFASFHKLFDCNILNRWLSNFYTRN